MACAWAANTGTLQQPPTQPYCHNTGHGDPISAGLYPAGLHNPEAQSAVRDVVLGLPEPGFT